MPKANKRQINHTLCDTCDKKFLCVQDCVTSYIEVQDGKPSFKARGFCLNCGHCNAICPKAAIEVEQDYDFNDAFIRFLSMKRTVRHYNKEQEISQTDLDLIVQAAQSAPSEKNRATVKICLIKEHLSEIFLEALEILKNHVEQVGPLHPQYHHILKLSEKKSPIFWGAEYAVVIIGKQQFSVDAALVAERMQLMAFSHGISSGYNGNLAFAINNSENLRKKLLIADGENALLSFALGYSDFDYKRPYIGTKRKVSYF